MQDELATKLSTELSGAAKRRFDIACSDILGRPTLYTPDHDVLVIYYSSLGYSTTQIIAEFGISRSTFYRWLKHNESFSNSYKKGRALSLAFYHDISNKNLMDSSFTMPQFLQLESIMSKRYGNGQDMVELPDFAEKSCGERLEIILSGVSSGEINVGAASQLISALKQAEEIMSIPDLVDELDNLKEAMKSKGE